MIEDNVIINSVPKKESSGYWVQQDDLYCMLESWIEWRIVCDDDYWAFFDVRIAAVPAGLIPDGAKVVRLEHVKKIWLRYCEQVHHSGYKRVILSHLDSDSQWRFRG